MQRFKGAWKVLRWEVRVYVLWLIAALPGRLGRALRRMAFRRLLKELGSKNVLQSGLRINSPENVCIGSHCNFAQDIFITGGGGVRIGDWVGLGPGVRIWSVNHRFDDPDKPWQLQGWDKQPVVIEDDVWLGAGAFVMPGVTIGKGAIVSACAVVGRSIPAFALVAGNPARVVGWRKQPPGEAKTAQFT